MMYNVYVSLHLTGTYKPVTVLVDNGADKSLLKLENICEQSSIDKSGIRTLGGAFHGSSKTLGVFRTDWIIKDKKISTGC